VSLYPGAFSVEANRIVFATRQLESLTTYELKASTREVSWRCRSRRRATCWCGSRRRSTTRRRARWCTLVYPVDSLMPVKGVHEVPVREGGRGVAEHAVGGSFSAVR